jgi:uncharacterized membrane protein YphA (DoxX/SURF4 family)
MKNLTNIARILVGVLFIISGLVKANDPLGLGYKMEEFFEVWNTSLQAGSFFAKGALIGLFNFFHAHSLALSVLMIALEIIAGVALLLGIWRRWVLNCLLVLIVFFTFLTAYAYLSGKFRSCGCFGDCLPITPLSSFLKDVVLVLLIVWLVIYRRYITPVFSVRTGRFVFFLTVLFSFVFQWYMLRFLPIVDCLPYKVGKNIPEQMKIPAGAVTDSFAMTFIYEKAGKRYNFGVSEFPADLGTYTFIDRKQTLVRKGNAEAPIKDFTLSDANGNDVTAQVLAEPRAVLVFVLNYNEFQKWLPDFKDWYAKARSKNVPLFVLTPETAKGKVLFNSAGLTDVVLLSCDYTAIKTAARAVPVVYLVEKGTIKAKAAAPKAEKIMKKIE